MPKRYRLTGCAKFFIVLIILIPVSLFIASMVVGVDPVEAVRDAWETEMMGNKNTTSDDYAADTPVSEGADNPIQTDVDVEQLEQDLDYYKSQAEQLKKDLEACQNAKQ